MKEADIRPQGLFDRYLAISRQDAERLLGDRSAYVDMSCPACGSAEHEPAFQKDGFEYVTCRVCASLYVTPRPSAEMLDDYYLNGEATKFWADSFFRETAEARRERIFRPRAAVVGEFAQRWDARGEFVDVGSGYGTFLEEVEALGVFERVIGIEPTAPLADICREKGFTIVEKSVEQLEPGEIRADFATAFEVVEHVFDVPAFMSAVSRALRPGGIFLFTTLTASGFDLQVLWERSKSISPPHHLNFVSIEGYPELLARSGFELLDLSTPGELDVDIVNNMRHEDPALPLPRFVEYLLDRRDEATHAEFQAFLQRNRLSSHVRVVARKI